LLVVEMYKDDETCICGEAGATDIWEWYTKRVIAVRLVSARGGILRGDGFCL
jgi:hypothetical protein